MPGEEGGDSGNNGSQGGSGESSGESFESGIENGETENSDLFTDESEKDLYDPGYDPHEYEEELLTDVSFTKNEKGEETVIQSKEEPALNKDGKLVPEVPIVKDEKYIKYSENYNETGEWSIDWDAYAKHSDGEGFDKNEKIDDKTTLEPGKVIARYGSDFGSNATDVGTDHSKLSLPYEENSQEYHEYQIIKPVNCTSGKAAPNFGEVGGGQQYHFSQSFAEMSNPNNPNRTMMKIR